MLYSVRLGWKKAMDGLNKTWDQFIKSLTIELKLINRRRLRGWDQRDYRN